MDDTWCGCVGVEGVGGGGVTLQCIVSTPRAFINPTLFFLSSSLSFRSSASANESSLLICEGGEKSREEKKENGPI